MPYSKQDIRRMSNDGDSLVSILTEVVRSGVEYPDAEWRVTEALGLKPDEVQEMADNYLEQT